MSFFQSLPKPSNPLLQHLAYQHRQGTAFFALKEGTGVIRSSGRRYPSPPVELRKDQPEAKVVVAVVGPVPVTVSRAHVPRVVVPTAAVKHSVRTG